MKKTLFIVTIFCMVLAFSTVAFASGTQTITVSANVESTVELSAEVGPNCGRAVIELNGKKDYIDFFFPVTYSGQTFTVSEPVKDENGDVVSNSATPITFIGTADVTITPSNGLLGEQTNVVNISDQATVKTDNPLVTEAANNISVNSIITPILADASSSLSGFAPSKLYDGLLASDNDGWVSDGTIPGDRWARYEFAEAISAERVVLTFGGGPSNAAADYTLDVANSADGPWTTVKTVTDNDSSVNDWTLDYEGKYKYFRIYITKVNLNNAPDTYSRVIEMSVYSSVEYDTSNYSYIVVPTSNITVSSVFNNGAYDFGADRLVDRKWANVETDSWVALNTDVSTPNWAVYDLGRPVMIGAAVVRHEAGFVTADFKIQGSNNNSDWTDLSTATSNTTSITFHQFTPSAYRYVRLYITKATDRADLATRISEFELYTPVYNN